MIGLCCGEINTAKPSGKEVKVQNVDCYCAEPPSGNAKAVVVLLPDVFGWKLPNTRLLADNLSQKGDYLVYIPEFMNGKALKQERMVPLEVLEAPGLGGQIKRLIQTILLFFTLIPWLMAIKAGVIKPRIVNFLKGLKEKEAADLPIGVAGYSWGGYWVVELCKDTEKTKDGKSLISCGFAATPINLNIPADVEAVKLPLSVAAAEDDVQLPKAKAEAVSKLLEGKTKKDEVQHEFILYEGARHGFAVRSPKSNPKENQKSIDAEDQALKWFQANLPN